MALILDVRFDHLIGDVAAAAAKIAARPHVSTPIALPDRRKLSQQDIGTFPLEGLDQPTDRHLGRDRQQHRHMIRRNVPLPDVYPLPAAFLANHLPNPFRHRTAQHFVAVLRDPDHVQMDGEYGMGAVTIIAHESSHSKRGCSSFRLKAGVLPFPIGDNNIKFVIRIKKNTQISNSRGVLVPAENLFRGLPRGGALILSGKRTVWGHSLYVIGLKMANGEFVIIVTPEQPETALENYKERWPIETLFICLKTRGFDLESTHMTDPKRLEKLMVFLAIAFSWAHIIGEWRHEIKPIKINHYRLEAGRLKSRLEAA